MLGYVGRFRQAAWLVCIVLVEVFVLVFNGFRCPLTDVAARYTEDRRDNFDIYLPVWIARRNKSIFGILFVLGSLFAVAGGSHGTTETYHSWIDCFVSAPFSARIKTIEYYHRGGL
jgi:hypothetical protein